MLYNNRKNKRLGCIGRPDNKASCTSPLLATVLLFTFLISGCQSSGPATNAAKNIGSGQKASPDEKQKADYRLALIALEKKDYSKAQTLLLELTNERPSLAGPWANLGLLNLMQKRPVEAEEYLSKALELNPKMPEALNLMGLLATHQRQIGSAKDYYQLAIKYKDDYSNAHYNLALLYDIYLQDIEKAVKHYRRYMQLTGDNDEETANWLEQLEITLKQSS